MLRVRGSSNRIYSTRTIDFGETNLKCLSDFCLFFVVVLMSKVASKKKSTSTKEYPKYFFNTFTILFTDDVILQRNMNYQQSTRKSPYALVFRSPRGN